jgi:hypothetical protein
VPFHQKVNNDARLTKMIDDLGISLDPKEPKAPEKEKKQDDQTDKKQKDQ